MDREQPGHAIPTLLAFEALLKADLLVTEAVGARDPGVENTLETCAAAFSFAAWTCAPATRKVHLASL